MPATILVVDDSSIIRSQIRAKLEEVGYTVTEAVHGRAALTYAEQQVFDLVITDMHMPELDGLSLVTELRKREQYATTPIFMLTTESDVDTVARGRAVGVTAWVTKPVRPDILLNGVKMVVPP